MAQVTSDELHLSDEGVIHCTVGDKGENWFSAQEAYFELDLMLAPLLRESECMATGLEQ